ncbi:TAT-variant-translocated molybdopterin oxidoreductase [Haloferula sp. A504]|uniref:TAT-variant-translocated molybdopterin oxidoreductase n=1 Tax=Haloferula sp. A504 TaxID=3373601 RepID=UPI0031C44597|nr:TAT-variant-translocated molybdopterin oxidoreductase [Verrucomicrobiaceae bacterium E54]
MSKRIWQHPELPADENTVAWRSTGQLENTADFREWLEREFPRGAAEMANQEEAETSRRSFLKLMGASTALAGFGMAACRRPEAHILPYAQAPEWVIPGKATYYASSFPRMGGATPLVVTSFEGRPTKLAPNTLHPDHAGTDSFAQASVLDLYSPYRSTRVLRNGQPSSRKDFEVAFTALAKDTGAKVGFLFGRDDSPTRARLRKELAAKFSNARFYGYEALEGEAHKAAGDGKGYVADFAKADRIVSLDCDFAGLDPVGPVTPFFDRRKPEGKDYDKPASQDGLNRLYAVESGFSLTGGMADHRLRIKPSQLLQVAAHIARLVGADAPVGGVEVPAKSLQEWITPLVDDLKEHAGRSAVVAGSRAPEVVHHFVAAINAKLGNVGEDKPLRSVLTGNEGLGDIEALTADLDSGAVEHLLLFTPSNPVYDAPADLKFGDALAKAKTSIHFGPRTDATAHLSTWHVPASHYLESWSDTRSASGVHTVVQPLILPLYADCASELEVLAALLSEAGVLLTGEGEEGAASPAHAEVRKTFAGLAGDKEEDWKKFLRDGFYADSKYEAAEPSLDSAKASELVAKAPKAVDGGLEVIFATDGSIYDGRWIDNGWLQEAPDPISKVSWDNVALIAPKTAKKLGIYDKIVKLETPTAAKPEDGEGQHRSGQLVKIKVNGVEMELPVQIGFGQAEDTVIVSLGYGQGFNADDELGRGPLNESHVGLVGVNSGFNVYPLRTKDTGYFAAVEGTLVATGTRYSIAAVQEHHSMYGRALAREVSTLEDKKKGDFEQQLASVKKHGMDSHIPPNISLYKPANPTDPLHQWGMSIDLSSCMGCNACLVACQAENNIPIVGKEQLAMGREMHWIRMDRYFAVQPLKDDEGNYVKEDGEKVYDEENIELIPQPVACVQCESAPCETVCPVNATVHTEDGLNAMAYNRCIGTRYCANNCPYKARRFNFFDYNKRNPLVPHNLYRGPLGEKQVGTAPHLQRNPNVSVRMRGVMEKCTYCVQRLKDSQIRQKRRQKQESLASGDSASTKIGTPELRIPVDSVKVACQEACPADAIAFGNLLDPDSRMTRAKGNDMKSIRDIVGEDEFEKIKVKGLDRNYDLLNYIGTRPRTSYLARVKNPNKAMPGAQSIGKATIHMH